MSQQPPSPPNQPPSSPGPPPCPPPYGWQGTNRAPALGRSGDPPPGFGIRRLLGLLGILGLVALAFLLFFALRGGSSGLNPVAAAAERTARISGGKLAMEVRYSVEGSEKSIVANGSGRFDARSGLTEAELVVPSPSGGAVRIESVGGDRVVYLRSAAFAAELPPGDEWLGMEPFLGHDPQTAFGTDGGAESSIAALQAVGGGVEKLDRQSVRGHLTTRYKGTIELGKAAQVLAEKGERALAREYEQLAERAPDPVQVEAWIDERGLVRQIRQVQKIPTPAGPAVTMDMRMQLYDFGAKPKIKLPPKRRVFDYTPILRAELGMDDGHSLGPLTPPAGARPLAPAAFRRKVRGICQRQLGVAVRIFRGNRGLSESMEHIDPGDLARARELGDAYGRRVGEPTYRMARDLQRELVAVVPPAGDAARYRRYLKLSAERAEGLLAVIRALRIGAFASPVIKNWKSENAARKRQIKPLAARLGIGSCETSKAGKGESALA